MYFSWILTVKFLKDDRFHSTLIFMSFSNSQVILKNKLTDKLTWCDGTFYEHLQNFFETIADFHVPKSAFCWQNKSEISLAKKISFWVCIVMLIYVEKHFRLKSLLIYQTYDFCWNLKTRQWGHIIRLLLFME